MNPPLSALPPQRLANSAPGARWRAPISLTPLIDVVFILLVFFMLTTSYLDRRSIDLGAPAMAAAGSSMDGALLVEIRPEGLRLAGAAITLEALVAHVRERVTTKPEQRVLIRPEAGVPLQRTVAVLDGLSAAGAANMSLLRAGGR